VYVYGPWRGTLDHLRLDGRELEVTAQELNGRPVASVDVLLSSRKPHRLSWTATTGPGQTGAGVVTATPSVVPGANRHAFASAC
jgi:hypothetical protein